jgi:hypothetical protein
MVQPKPQLSETIWDDEADVSHIMSTLALEGKLVADKDGGFVKQQQAYLTNPSMFYPARYAMMCILAGMDEYRWPEAKRTADYD